MTERDTTILLVDDHPLVRDGLRARLEAAPRLRVVGEAASNQEALEQAGLCQPDLVLMDVNLQEGGNGIDAAHQLRAFERPPIVLFLTSYVDSETRRLMEEAQPFGIVQKPYAESQLQQTVAKALGG